MALRRKTEGKNSPFRALLPLVGVLGALAAVALAVGAAVGPPREPASLAAKGELTTSAASLIAPSGALQGNVLSGSAGTQFRIGGTEAVRDPLAAGLVPTIVADSAGRIVAYSTWQQLAKLNPNAVSQGVQAGMPFGRPSVHLLDTASGAERKLADGARSPALSADGKRIAFFKAPDPIFRINEEYTGHLFVGDPASADFAQWTTEAARYFPFAWSGSTLLAYRAKPQSEGVDLLALSGPGQTRLIAPDAYAIALSPDGSQVLAFADQRVLELIRTADGAVLASLALDGQGVAAIDSPSTPHSLMFNGSWAGDRVVANSDVGLLALKVSPAGIAIESILATPSLPHGINEPVLDDAGVVTGWADISPLPVVGNAPQEFTQALVRCDLTNRSCETGTPREPTSVARWIANPSR